MILVDANLLVYAILPREPRFHRAKEWLHSALTGAELVALPWGSLLAFLRITTSPKLHAHPLSAQAAVGIVKDWLALPIVVAPTSGPRHPEILLHLLEETGRVGSHITDAHLAALAIENAATLCSSDRDFERFPGLRWANPLTG